MKHERIPEEIEEYGLKMMTEHGLDPNTGFGVFGYGHGNIAQLTGKPQGQLNGDTTGYFLLVTPETDTSDEEIYKSEVGGHIIHLLRAPAPTQINS